MLRALIIALIPLAALPALGAPEPQLSMNTPRMHLVFDKNTGALLSLQDRETGRQWLAPGGAPALYELSLSRPGQPPLRLTLAQATGVRAKRVMDGIQINAEAHGDTHVGVRLTFTADPYLGTVECRLSVKNDSGLALQQVQYPILPLPAKLGESAEDDAVVLPICDGLEICNPEANLRGTRAGQYPGSASMQFLAVTDGAEGLYAATLDSEGNRKILGASRAGDTVVPVITHFPIREAREQWSIPYPVSVVTYAAGGWQMAAELYRAWAQKQPWCRTPLAKRKDIPAWAFQPAFYYAVSLRGEMPGGGEGDRTPLLSDQIAGYHQALGAPVVAMLMSWEKQGAWVTPDYFPPFGGADAFRALTAQLHKQGDHSLVFLSGLKWTLRKTSRGMNYDDEADFTARAEKGAIVGEDGQVQHFGKPGDDTGEYAQLCPAAPLAYETLSNAIRECQALGVDSVQIDQLVGGGMPPCYSKEHGHPAGGGSWSAQAVFRLFQRLRDEARERNKEFLFLMEEPGEMFIPVLDAYHARDYAEGRWPRDGVGVRGLPLFTYVYHDYCLGYGGDSAPLGPGEERFSPYQHALNLINGKLPAGAVWSRWQKPEAVQSDQMTLLKNAEALLTSPASEFLLRGKRVAVEPMPAPPLTLKVSVQGQPVERAYPSVLHAAYGLPDGRIGHLYINLGLERRRIEIPIATVGTSGHRVRLTTYSATDGKVERQSEEVYTPAMQPLTLQPLVPVLLECANAGWDTPH